MIKSNIRETVVRWSFYYQGGSVWTAYCAAAEYSIYVAHYLTFVDKAVTPDFGWFTEHLIRIGAS